MKIPVPGATGGSFGGQRTEADHIVGDMLERARAGGIDPGPLRAACAHLQAYQARRKRTGG